MPSSADRRIGLIARCTRSGLGYLSKSFYEHFRPDVVICVTDCDRRYRDNIDWYPDATFVRHADMGKFPYERFCTDLHAVLSYETFYHAKVLQTAKRMDVRTVLMGMPELTRRRGDSGWLGDPWRQIWPTSWLLPDKGRVVPVPVDPGFAGLHAYPYHDGPLRVLHVAGARAVGDRNGSDAFVSALHQVRHPVYVRLCVNDAFLPDVAAIPPHVTVDVWRDTVSREAMYDGMHVLVLPRRYGGLSLVAQEAAAAGLALLMTDCEPNQDYPARLMRATPGGTQRVPIGKVATFDVRPREIAEHIDLFASDPGLLALAQKASQEWAAENTWDKLRHHYCDAFNIIRR